MAEFEFDLLPVNRGIFDGFVFSNFGLTNRGIRDCCLTDLRVLNIC